MLNYNEGGQLYGCKCKNCHIQNCRSYYNILIHYYNDNNVVEAIHELLNIQEN